jgi:hypothetical protein
MEHRENWDIARQPMPNYLCRTSHHLRGSWTHASRTRMVSRGIAPIRRGGHITFNLVVAFIHASQDKHISIYACSGVNRIDYRSVSCRSSLLPPVADLPRPVLLAGSDKISGKKDSTETSSRDCSVAERGVETTFTQPVSFS